MNKALSILTVIVSLSFFVSCGAKKEVVVGTTAGTPEATQQTNNVVTSVAPSTQEAPFVIPASSKKQAKYFPEGSPTRAIQDLDDMMDSYITDVKGPEDEKYNARLKEAVLKGTFDIRELCRLALDKHWVERTSQEQDDFVTLMTNLLEKKAIFSKEQGQKKKKGSSYNVTYIGQKFLDKDENMALTTSRVFVPSENLKVGLNYKLKKENNIWKIFDVIVDDASLLENYKYQFDRIIQKEGYAGLVKRMQTKFEQIDKKNS